jgi:hypothetical protein
MLDLKKQSKEYVYLDKFMKVKEKIISKFATQDAEFIDVRKQIESNKKKIKRMEILVWWILLLCSGLTVLFLYTFNK